MLQAKQERFEPSYNFKVLVSLQSASKEIQEAANKSFELLKSNSQHPSLHFKKLDKVWFTRVTLDYRALAVERPNGLLWFWIGAHDEYERLL